MEFEKIKKDNREKYIIGSLAILIIVSTIFFVATRANYKVTEKINIANGIINYSQSDLSIMAIKIQKGGNGYDDISSVPTNGYTLSDKSYCEVNGAKDTSITMEYKDGKVFIPVNTKNTKCYLYFDEIALIGNATDIIASSKLSNENGYRFQGANPNNHVTFNNELWRIIGVFDVINSETGKTESLIKLIRKETLDMYTRISWDTLGTNGSNNWTTSDLEIILNGQYYNGENINYTYRNPSNSYVSSNKTVSIMGVSLNASARAMVQSVVWNLGGVSSVYLTAEEFYNAERGTAVYSGNPTYWNGRIGLMYASDYGYAVDAASCPRTTTLNSYSNSSCKNNNWLYDSRSNSQWTLTTSTANNQYVFQARNDGYIYYINAAIRNEVRPSIYLKSSVKITGGDGTSSNPYTLSM